jgi:hypothetical protein
MTVMTEGIEKKLKIFDEMEHQPYHYGSLMKASSKTGEKAKKMRTQRGVTVVFWRTKMCTELGASAREAAAL